VARYFMITMSDNGHPMGEYVVQPDELYTSVKDELAIADEWGDNVVLCVEPIDMSKEEFDGLKEFRGW
jgi:hypothetical protein